MEQVVVGIDGSPASFEGFEQALHLSRQTGSALRCVYVVDSRKTEVPIIYSGSSFDISLERVYLPLDPNLKSYYLRIAEDLRAFARRCLDVCEERGRRAGVVVTSVIREGFPTAELCAEGRSGDLLVVGQKGENAQYRRAIVGSTTEDLVRTAPLPILVVPVHRETVRCILAVYDGGRASESALRFYANALKGLAEELVLFEVEASDSPGAAEEELELLRTHGIGARLVRQAETVNMSVIDAAQRERADLILTGAYGKHKIKAYLLGVTAAHLLRRSTVPVLIVY